MIEQAGSRAQHLQRPNRRLNGRAHRQASRRVGAFPRVLLRFRCYDDHRESDCASSCDTFGAGALIHDGRKGCREAQRANRRLNSRLFRRRLVRTFAPFVTDTQQILAFVGLLAVLFCIFLGRSDEPRSPKRREMA